MLPQQTLHGIDACRARRHPLLADPRPAPIRITDNRGGSWTATITEVVSRNQQRIVVRDSGRP